jgi:chromosome segregation ATPase
MSNDLINQKMEIIALEKKLSVAESKLRQNAAEKSSETRTVNNKFQIELQQANDKVQHLENRVAEFEGQLKGTKKRGFKRPSPWWYLHTDPVPEHVIIAIIFSIFS